MAVYFACRSPYCAPGGKHLKRFDDDNVLDWFRNRWERLAGTDAKAVSQRVEREMGCYVYSFHCLFLAVEERGLPMPETADDLAAAIQSTVYVNDVLCDGPHLIQVGTDDDEVGLSYYFFDDHYLARHGKRAAFLLQGDWRLPGGCGTGKFRPAEPTEKKKTRGTPSRKTWSVDLDHVGDLDDLVPPEQIDGVRIPELARHLSLAPPDPDASGRLIVLRPLLLMDGLAARPIEKAFLKDARENPADDTAWNAYSDWLIDQGKPEVGLYLLQRGLARAAVYNDPDFREEDYPNPWDLAGKDLPSACTEGQILAEALDAHPMIHSTLVHVDEHSAQVCFRVAEWKYVGRSIFEQWILFDDLWAGARPDLANAILRYVQRWDVLSSSRTPRNRE